MSFQLGEIGIFDPHPFPIIDKYPRSQTVEAGSFVEFECKASDAADHLPNWPKHDLVIDLYYENDESRDLTSSELFFVMNVKKDGHARL